MPVLRKRKGVVEPVDDETPANAEADNGSITEVTVHLDQIVTLLVEREKHKSNFLGLVSAVGIWLAWVSLCLFAFESSSAYQVTAPLRTFATAAGKAVTDKASYLTWLETTFFPLVYPVADYNGNVFDFDGDNSGSSVERGVGHVFEFNEIIGGVKFELQYVRELAVCKGTTDRPAAFSMYPDCQNSFKPLEDTASLPAGATSQQSAGGVTMAEFGERVLVTTFTDLENWSQMMDTYQRYPAQFQAFQTAMENGGCTFTYVSSWAAAHAYITAGTFNATTFDPAAFDASGSTSGSSANSSSSGGTAGDGTALGSAEAKPTLLVTNSTTVAAMQKRIHRRMVSDWQCAAALNRRLLRVTAEVLVFNGEVRRFGSLGLHSDFNTFGAASNSFDVGSVVESLPLFHSDYR
jgi:hypothetical protein